MKINQANYSLLSRLISSHYYKLQLILTSGLKQSKYVTAINFNLNKFSKFLLIIFTFLFIFFLFIFTSLQKTPDE